MDIRLLLLKETVVAAAANTCPSAQELNVDVALLRSHLFQPRVDRFSPDPVFCWRRASTSRKAPLKKSTSNVFSASAVFNCLMSRSLGASASFRRFVPEGSSLPTAG